MPVYAMVPSPKPQEGSSAICRNPAAWEDGRSRAAAASSFLFLLLLVVGCSFWLKRKYLTVGHKCFSHWVKSISNINVSFYLNS